MPFVQLSPFVTQKMRPTHGNYSEVAPSKGPASPILYLERWKLENGVD